MNAFKSIRTAYRRVLNAVGIDRPAVRAARARVYEKAQVVRARYEAAQTTDENVKHWSGADDLSAAAANSSSVRHTLRRRARYERDNGCHCSGLIETAANEVIGTGPRPQLQTSNEEANRVIERRFGEWMRAVGLAEKLRMAERYQYHDGELFGILINNPATDCEVKLDIQTAEGDQITTPFPKYGPDADPKAVDGIRFDGIGNPKEYDLLEFHPGGEGEFGQFQWNLTPRPLAAANVIHWYVMTRSGQKRGVPLIIQALGLLAQLRRYGMAVLQAAELSACLTAVLETDYPPGSTEIADDLEGFEVTDIKRGMFQMLPAGVRLNAFRSEQPVTGYGEYCIQVLKEICRCIPIPFAIAMGDSSDSNYAGGRLDVQGWVRQVTIKRSRYEQSLNRIFKAWLDEASKIEGYIPIEDLGPPNRWRLTWFWDGFGHVDPQKEASATDMALRNLTTTLERFYASQGLDWREQISQIKIELEACKEAGVPHPAVTPAPAPAMGKNGANPLDEGEKTDPSDPDGADQAKEASSASVA